MTATSNELTAPSRGLVAALRHSIPRDEFFAGLYILGCANGLLGRILLSFNSDGWIGVLGGRYQCDRVVRLLCRRIDHVLRRTQDEIRSADLAVAAVFLILVILPIFALSWVAVTGLSLYILLFANDGSERRRGALILLALTVPMLWSGLLFQFFARPILEIDASLVAWLLGTERVGNMVRFCRRFRIHGRIACLFLARQYVSRIPVLGQRHAVGQAPVVRDGYFVVPPCLHLGDRSECHTDQPYGIEPVAL